MLRDMRAFKVTAPTFLVADSVYVEQSRQHDDDADGGGQAVDGVVHKVHVHSIQLSNDVQTQQHGTNCSNSKCLAYC